MQLNVKNETSTLKAVALGQPGFIGKVPTLEETYDAKPFGRTHSERSRCVCAR